MGEIYHHASLFHSGLRSLESRSVSIPQPKIQPRPQPQPPKPEPEPKPSLPLTSLLLINMHGLRVTITQQAHSAPLAADAALLVAAEDGLRHGPLAAVDEDAAGFELVGDAQGAVDVEAPDAGAQAGVGGVGAGDDFRLGGPGLAGDDGTCGEKGGRWLVLGLLLLLWLWLWLLLGSGEKGNSGMGETYRMVPR